MTVIETACSFNTRDNISIIYFDEVLIILVRAAFSLFFVVVGTTVRLIIVLTIRAGL